MADSQCPLSKCVGVGYLQCMKFQLRPSVCFFKNKYTMLLIKSGQVHLCINDAAVLFLAAAFIFPEVFIYLLFQTQPCMHQTLIRKCTVCSRDFRR